MKTQSDISSACSRAQQSWAADARRQLVVLKALKFAGFIFVIAPILFLVQCVYIETSQRNNLNNLCENSNVGKAISSILDEARNEKFEIRGESHKSKKEGDWFNRQYEGFLEAFRENNNVEDSLTIIFAKPGIGYYACEIEHFDGLVKKARFLDRSS